MNQSLFTKLIAIVAGLLLAAFAGAAEDVEKQRAEIRKACDEALGTVYKAKPEVKAAISKSAGYGCFSSFGIAFIVGGAGGHGLVHNNATKSDTYMRMGQATAGLDIGIKDYREVLLFKNLATLDKFVNSGWEFTGSAGASAKAGEKGGATDAAKAGADIDVYPITKSGLQIGFSVGPRKYWKNNDLNAK